MTQNQILQRLNRLEQQVEGLQKKLKKSKGSKVEKTWRDYIGMFKDDPDFQKAVEFGARWRRSFRPKPESNNGKK